MDRALDRTTVALCGLWIAILLTSGALEPEVLTLHLFQSLIYVAVAVLTLRGSKWAPGLGISIAFIWNYGNLRTGRGVQNVVQFMAPLAFFAHVALIVILAVRYLRRVDRRRLDGVGFGVAFVVTFAYFAVILSLYGPQFLPRFLDLFALR